MLHEQEVLRLLKLGWVVVCVCPDWVGCDGCVLDSPISWTQQAYGLHQPTNLLYKLELWNFIVAHKFCANLVATTWWAFIIEFNWPFVDQKGKDNKNSSLHISCMPIVEVYKWILTIIECVFLFVPRFPTLIWLRTLFRCCSWHLTLQLWRYAPHSSRSNWSHD